MKKIIELDGYIQTSGLTKIIRVMKITSFLLLVSVASLFASKSYSQTKMLNINEEHATVKDVLSKIEDQSEFYFMYSGKVIDADRIVSVDVEDHDVDVVLNQLFAGTDVDYTIRDRIIVLTTSEVFSPESLDALQQKSVVGVVSDRSGYPIPGVTVLVKGTSLGTITNVDGEYNLDDVPEDATLVFSFVGLNTQEIEVAGRSNISVTMTEAFVGLDEIVAIGYGTMRKSDLTGAVAAIQESDISKISSTNLGQAMQGKMSGVQVTQSSGRPGAGVDVKVRGVGSILSNNSALVLVNGFEGSLDDLDADNIESITVLKDAAAASIYGSRAANGVILVQTKTGKKGDVVVTLKSELGFQSLTQSPNYLKTFDFANKENEEMLNNGELPLWTGDLAPENLTEYTDWKDFVFNDGAIHQDYNLGITGGSDNTRYALNLGYVNQEGTVIGTDFDRYNVRLNIEHDLKDWLTVGANLSSLRSNYNYNMQLYDSGGRGALNLIALSSPTLPPYTNGKPTLPRYPGEQYMWNLNVSPALISDHLKSTETINKSVINAFAEFKILEGLKFKIVGNGLFSNRLDDDWADYWAYFSEDDPSTPAIESSAATLSNRSSENTVWEIQNLLTYSKTFGKHNLDVLLGLSSQKNASRGFFASAADFPNNQVQVLGAANTMLLINGSESEDKLYSQFGRLNYDYQSKYLAQVNVRRDGSSVFAPGNQYGVFPSFSLGWRISEESFFEVIDFVDNLKIRASYGTLGNARIPSFAWISTFNVNSSYVLGAGQTQVPAYSINDMTNESVQWESTTTTNFGIDITALNNRLSLVADYYVKNTFDMLLRTSIPPSSGYRNGPIINLGEVKNEGWEAMLSYNNRVGELSYSTSFNISHNKNELVDMGGTPAYTTWGTRVEEGRPLFVYWGYLTDGIWQTQDEIDNNPSLGNAQPGGVRYKDINGYDEEGNLTGKPDGIIDGADRTEIGNYQPKFLYGFNLSAEYRNFDITIFFQGEEEKSMLIESSFGGNGIGRNIDQYYYDNRTILGSDGNVSQSGSRPALGRIPSGGEGYTDFNLHDISYLRMKNFQVGYNIPKRFVNNLGLNSVRWYLNMLNPLTWTNYRGYDPEMEGGQHNGLVSRGGVDYYPMFKSTTIGLRVTF